MRHHVLDNAKAVLIFLVVFGHSLELVDGWNVPLLKGLLTSIYMFHMPAFVFLAGVTYKLDGAFRRALQLGVLLIGFQIAYTFPITLYSGSYPTGYFQPYWILWFLLGMIWWISLAPLIKKLPHPLLASSLLAICVGAMPFDGYLLSISRVFVFLPFFVAGHLHGRKLLDLSRSFGAWRYSAIGIFILCAATAIALVPEKGWLYGSLTYSKMEVSSSLGMLIRLGILALAAISLVAFIISIPPAKTIISVVGQRSLAIFVLHGFSVKLAGHPLSRMGIEQDYLLLLFSLALTIFTVAILSAPLFDRLIRRISGHLTDWMLSSIFPKEVIPKPKR